MSKKQPIQVINNYKSLLEVIPSNIDDNTYMFNENITSILNQRQNKINDYIIGEIIKFMEKENIRLCFVINEEEMADCLQEHNKLHLKLEDLQHKLDQQKAMWNELKEWVKNKSIEIKRVNAINEEMAKIKDYIDMTYRECYIKIQELEQGEKDVKD